MPKYEPNTPGSTPNLPAIPVYDVGPDWPYETLEIEFARAEALLDEAGRRIPGFAIRAADKVSRRWLERWHEPYLAEIDRIAERLGRPGAHYLNVSYEWGCTSSAAPSPDNRTARLVRILDWPEAGLGRNVMAARIRGEAGDWVTLTWPGYTGVLQAMAPGRFAAALNQAPMDRPVGLYAADWAVNRWRVWRTPHLTPSHLLRQVFEQARHFEEARRMLTETPVALPTIYILAGCAPGETLVIERKPEDASVIDGPACAANSWQTPGWSGQDRGEENAERQRCMTCVTCELDDHFDWLAAPILNDRTRLAFAADAAAGRLIAQGWETDGPATSTLDLGKCG